MPKSHTVGSNPVSGVAASVCRSRAESFVSKLKGDASLGHRVIDDDQASPAQLEACIELIRLLQRSCEARIPVLGALRAWRPVFTQIDH